MMENIGSEDGGLLVGYRNHYCNFRESVSHTQNVFVATVAQPKEIEVYPNIGGFWQQKRSERC